MNSKLKSKNIIPIILAAGRGSRMRELTKSKPKSFVIVNKKKRLIDQIIENFTILGLKKITVITGYKSNKFNQFKKINTIKNKKWKTTNIFGSLICADKILSKNTCIISYADIFYDKNAIKLLKSSKIKSGIVMLSYTYWKEYWKKRFKSPLSDLETFKIDKKNNLIDIGKRTNSYKNIKGQFMGIFKIDPNSWIKIKKHLFKNIKNLDKIDITTLFQIILKKNICKIYVENYKKKWFEIDSIKDYKLFKRLIKV